jgi:hypothetical protein
MCLKYGCYVTLKILILLEMLRDKIWFCGDKIAFS